VRPRVPRLRSYGERRPAARSGCQPRGLRGGAAAERRGACGRGCAAPAGRRAGLRRAGGWLAGSLALASQAERERRAVGGEGGADGDEDGGAARRAAPGRWSYERERGGERRTWRPGALLRPQRHRGVYDYTFMSVWGVRGTGARCRDWKTRRAARYLRARVRIFPGRGQGGGSCAYNLMLR
jgi:hypothetical protein